MARDKNRVPYGKGMGTPRNQPTPKKIKDLLSAKIGGLYGKVTIQDGEVNPVFPEYSDDAFNLLILHREFVDELMDLLNVKAVVRDNNVQIEGRRKRGRPVASKFKDEPVDRTRRKFDEDLGLDDENLEGIGGNFGGRS